MPTHFIVHEKSDNVGVITVEDVTPDQDLTGWLMDLDETLHIRAKEAIPLGHKIALRAVGAGDTVYKYGHDIGRAVASVEPGRHVHVHNVKTKRW